MNCKFCFKPIKQIPDYWVLDWDRDKGKSVAGCIGENFHKPIDFLTRSVWDLAKTDLARPFTVTDGDVFDRVDNHIDGTLGVAGV